MSIADRVYVVRASIAAACEACGRDPEEVELLPVSKRQPLPAIREALASGLCTLGENRVQELDEKAAEFAGSGASWHLIGSLQTNKVNQLLRIPDLALLHSMDRVKLADALQFALARESRKLQVLIQVNATGEGSKHGVAVGEASALLKHLQDGCPALEVVGLMAMGPLHSDSTRVFREVARLREDLRQRSGLHLNVLSMGMTGDLVEAISAGSTMVRVGTAVFGPRPEPNRS